MFHSVRLSWAPARRIPNEMSRSIGRLTLLCLAGTISRAAASVPLLNASSLNSSSSAIVNDSPQNSVQYVYGNCANATALSTAYTTISSFHTMVVSTIAPSATCCTKCEIGADMVCYGLVKHIPGVKGSRHPFRRSHCS